MDASCRRPGGDMMMMIACITVKSGLVPLIEGLCDQIVYLRIEIIGGLRRHSFKSIERSVEVWKGWIRYRKEFATLREDLPPAELLPAKHKEQSPAQNKRDTSRKEFGQRVRVRGNIWESLSCLLTLLESFGADAIWHSD